MCCKYSMAVSRTIGTRIAGLLVRFLVTSHAWPSIYSCCDMFGTPAFVPLVSQPICYEQGAMKHDHKCSPPTFAFDASSRSLRLKPSSLPMPRVRAKCIPICMEEKRKREGAVAMTILMLPAAPTAAKKIWQVKHQQCIRPHVGCSAIDERTHAALTKSQGCCKTLHSDATEQLCCVNPRLGQKMAAMTQSTSALPRSASSLSMQCSAC